MKKVLALVFVAAAVFAVACKKDNGVEPEVAEVSSYKDNYTSADEFNALLSRENESADASYSQTNYLEVDRTGKKKPYLRLVIGVTSIHPAIYIYFPTEKTAPYYRTPDAGYCRVEKDWLDEKTAEHFKQGIIRISSESGRARYGFVFEDLEGKVYSLYATPNDDSYPAGEYYDESYLHFPASSFVKATYLAAGSAGGEADFDCLKIDYSTVHAEGHVDFTLTLLLNEAINNELYFVEGSYVITSSASPCDHAWKISPVIFYNEWEEATFKDPIYPSEDMKTAVVTRIWDGDYKIGVSAKCWTLMNRGINGGTQPLEIDETTIPESDIVFI